MEPEAKRRKRIIAPNCDDDVCVDDRDECSAIVAADPTDAIDVDAGKEVDY